MKFEGTVHKFGSEIDTDVIIPARYLTSTDPAELGAHAMEPADPEFPARCQPGDIMVAGRNFGSGSSREHAPMAIKGAGIACIVATSYARIFYRNAINIGLPVLECPEAVEGTEAGDRMEVEPLAGVVRNLTKGTEWRATPYPDFMRQLLEAGGLIPFTRARLQATGVVRAGSGSAAGATVAEEPKEADFRND